tara:strand:+ start:213 stop:377 length:165 start_codon:yes stop_codon:yes gene_type:complete
VPSNAIHADVDVDTAVSIYVSQIEKLRMFEARPVDVLERRRRLTPNQVPSNVES